MSHHFFPSLLVAHDVYGALPRKNGKMQGLPVSGPDTVTQAPPASVDPLSPVVKRGAVIRIMRTDRTEMNMLCSGKKEIYSSIDL